MNKIEVKTDMYSGIINPIHMEFLNGGKITIPGKYGAYVVASGCGSGKTTIIKELIKTQKYRGILYSASTIKECDEMYEWVKELYISEGIENRLTDDVIVLHSDYRSNGTDNNLWRNNPLDRITRSRIKSPLTQDENGNLYYEYPRQLILIDEMPTCSSFKVTISKSIIKLISNRVTHKEIGEDGIIYDVPDDPAVYYKTRYDHMLRNYDNDVSDDLKFTKGYDNLSQFRKEMILSLVYINYDKIISSNGDKVTISYNASSLALGDQFDTRIILFDGTGDLTFLNSEGFNLLTFNSKYNSPINLTKIEYNLKRYQKPDSNENNIRELLEDNVLKLKEIIDNNPEGTLIVTWKNLKSDEYRITKGTLNITNNLLNEEFSLTEFYRKRLIQMGVTNPFEIIHYMSGLDKATNEFRNFSSIIFLGEFHVPNYVVSEFNCEYSCNTNSENYLTYQLVQAVCRTRIRNHKGESVNIYFTDDWDEKSIDNMVHYISSNKVIRKDTSLDFIKPKWRNQCKKLMEISEEFRNLVTYKLNGEVKFTLDEVYKAIPMTYKEVRVYYPLINYFRKLGIEITIKTNSNNKGYKS